MNTRNENGILSGEIRSVYLEKSQLIIFSTHSNNF